MYCLYDEFTRMQIGDLSPVGLFSTPEIETQGTCHRSWIVTADDLSNGCQVNVSLGFKAVTAPGLNNWYVSFYLTGPVQWFGFQVTCDTDIS